MRRPWFDQAIVQPSRALSAEAARKANSDRSGRKPSQCGAFEQALRVKGNVGLEIAEFTPQLSPSGRLFQPSFGYRDQSVDEGVQSQQL
jgi:hypothetical protein